jgi:hypothetical protein
MKLTATHHPAILSVPCNSKVGRGNPFSCTGEKTPLQYVVFLCLPFYADLICVFKVMTGLFCWAALEAGRTCARHFHPDLRTPPPFTVESKFGDYSHEAQEKVA